MILLHHFTWQQFGIAATILAVIWYGVIWLVYYRKPAPELTKETAAKEPLAHYWEDAEEYEPFGNAAEDESVSLAFSDNIAFAGKPRQDERENTEDALRGLIPDVLEEIKSIVHTVETKGGDKADFISLFKLVSAKYDRLKTSHHLEAINEWIADNTPFNLTGEELWQLWE